MNSFDKDWVMAQGLGGLAVEDELQRLRAVHEPKLHEAREKFLENRGDAEAAIDGLNLDRQEFAPEPLTTDDVLGVATVEIKERADEFHRNAQAEKAFQLRHGLPRAAEEPQTILTFVFIILMILIEALGGTGFLLNAQLAASPLSAILFSLLVSLTNVVVSVLAGFYIGRWKKYGLHATDADNPLFIAIRNRARWQHWGYITVILTLHSLLGLVRVQKTLDSVQLSLGGYLSIITTPEALFLVLTGIGMSVISYHKGMTAFTDSYPYYSQYHKATVTAYEAWQMAYADYVAEIENRHGVARAALDQAWNEHRKETLQVGRTFNHCLTTRSELVRAVDEAESALRTDITALDQVYRAARGDNASLPDAALDQLASYQNFLVDSDPPDFGEHPAIHSYRKALDEAKADALYELRTLFEAFHSNHGGFSQ